MSGTNARGPKVTSCRARHPLQTGSNKSHEILQGLPCKFSSELTVLGQLGCPPTAARLERVALARLEDNPRLSAAVISHVKDSGTEQTSGHIYLQANGFYLLMKPGKNQQTVVGKQITRHLSETSLSRALRYGLHPNRPENQKTHTLNSYGVCKIVTADP